MAGVGFLGLVLLDLVTGKARLRLAEAILLVNEWQESGGSPQLVEAAQQKMAEFGVTFVDDARPEAAAALALLLFGDPDAPMPGGFSSAELSAESPIKAIASFPQELVSSSAVRSSRAPPPRLSWCSIPNRARCMQPSRGLPRRGMVGA